MLFLTISRSLGSYGDEVARQLAEDLQLPLIDRQMAFKTWLPEVTSDHQLHMLRHSYEFYKHDLKDGLTFQEYLEKKLREQLDVGPCIFLGMGSQLIFSDHPLAVHVRLFAPEPVRVSRVMDAFGLNEQQARNTVAESDNRRRKYVRRLYRQDLEDPYLYHLSINTERLSAVAAVSLIKALIEEKRQTSGFAPGQLSFFAREKAEGGFRHQIEQEFADILDSYGVRWAYEPTTFPVKWDEEGNIVKAIAPDFYLADYQTYIELTVMDPKYMSEKKKKVQLLKELYPELNIILMDKKRLKAFMERFALKRGGDLHEDPR